jgi:hypothetical protein
MIRVVLLGLVLTWGATAAQATQLGLGVTDPLAVPVETALVGMPACTGGLSLGEVQTSALNGFGISVTAGATLAANAQAMAALDRAVNQWESWIGDDITVNISANMANLGSGPIIGLTLVVVLQGPYTLVRDAMVADASDEMDDAIVQSLPTLPVQFLLPAGFGLNGRLAGSKGNLKALGFAGLDVMFGANDATLMFNSQYPFDYNNSDGVLPGTIDFETVVAHEIGHALGFISSVDVVDWLLHMSWDANVAPTTLDMFRFWDDPNGNPSTAGEFAAFPRLLAPGYEAITDQIDAFGGVPAEMPMSTGYYCGDGRQASHWKDDHYTGELIGVMDPTLGYGVVEPVTAADLRALDLIGYEITVPEPAAMVVLSLGGVTILLNRLRRRKETFVHPFGYGRRSS